MRKRQALCLTTNIKAKKKKMTFIRLIRLKLRKRSTEIEFRLRDAKQLHAIEQCVEDE